MTRPRQHATEKPSRQGPLGDVRPEHGDDPRTGGGMDQEPVDRRPVVGKVKPSDYPEKDRAEQAMLSKSRK